jgi:WD40 repeat protein
MNLFDIDTDKGFFIIAVENKVGILQLNRFKSTNFELTGKIKYIIESAHIINHIKLMYGKDDNIYLLAIDNGGILHSKMFTWDKAYCEKEYKTFSCCIDAHDNSTWSLDCKYPYIAVGGNHRCIIVNNIEEEKSENEVHVMKNMVLSGNAHNVPYVTICDNFVACNSIDGKPKIWDLYNGKLVKVFDNKTKEW